jgi:hypothetical protein
MAHRVDTGLLRRPGRRQALMGLRRCAGPFALFFLLLCLPACSGDHATTSPALSPSDQDFIASRHGGM